MGKAISVGVIGAGFGQQVHVPAFQSDPRCIVRALCDVRLDKAQEVAARLNVPKAYADPAELINDPEIDVVSIAVPPTHQPALIEAVARAGKHVFCEKPLGAVLEDARRACQAVQRAGVRNAIDLLFPEIPAWQKAKAILDAGSLGRLRHMSVSWRVETYAYKQLAAIGDGQTASVPPSWKTRTGEGGGTLNNFVSHSVYYIEWLLGRASRLAARLRPKPQGDVPEAQADAWLQLENGTAVTLSVATDAFLGSGHRIEIYGDAGTMTLANGTPDYVHGFELLMGRRDDGKLGQVVSPQQPTGDGRVMVASSIARRLIDSIESGATVVPGVAEGLRAQELLEAMRKADDTGRWQNV